MSEKLIPEQILEKIKTGIDAEIVHLAKRKGSEENFPQQATHYQTILLTNFLNYFAQESTEKTKLNKRMRKLLRKLAERNGGERYQKLISTLDETEIDTITETLKELISVE